MRRNISNFINTAHIPRFLFQVGVLFASHLINWEKVSFISSSIYSSLWIIQYTVAVHAFNLSLFIFYEEEWFMQLMEIFLEIFQFFSAIYLYSNFPIRLPDGIFMDGAIWILRLIIIFLPFVILFDFIKFIRLLRKFTSPN